MHRNRKRRGRPSLPQHQLLQWEEMGASTVANAGGMNDSYLSGLVEDDNRMRQFCGWTDGWECDGPASVLTLVELLPAARVAEGAERPRLQATPDLHLAFGRPGFINQAP